MCNERGAESVNRLQSRIPLLPSLKVHVFRIWNICVSNLRVGHQSKQLRELHAQPLELIKTTLHWMNWPGFDAKRSRRLKQRLVIDARQA